MSTKPVVVYGASGYTGRLVCEYLREHNIPFVAAGRSKDRLASSMERNVPGIETADYEIAEVEHSADGLTKLLTGAKVLINTVGPFAQFGHEAVQACLSAGCHYTDTNGEQDWMIDAATRSTAQEFANARACSSPPASPRCTPPARSPPRSPSSSCPASTPSTSRCSGRAPRPWPRRPPSSSTPPCPRPTTSRRTSTSSGRPTAELYNVVVPGQHELGLALPWGGTSHPVWFKHDPRVQNVKVLGGILNRPLMKAVPQIVPGRPRRASRASSSSRSWPSSTSRPAGSLRRCRPGRTPGSTSRSTPSTPRARSAGSTPCSTATATTSRPVCSTPTPPPSCSSGGNRKVGFASACQAFGHQELLGVLQELRARPGPGHHRQRLNRGEHEPG